MTPDLAQVLHTLAHEIRTPLAVSQGYTKLLLAEQLTDPAATRNALEQTALALDTLAAYCADMGRISTLAGSGSRGIPLRFAVTDLVNTLREHADIGHAAFVGSASTGQIASPSPRDLTDAVAIVAKSAFGAAQDAAHAVETFCDNDGLCVLAGPADALPTLHSGPATPTARPVNFGKGGHGLKLIWAAFVLDRHGVEAWTDSAAPAAVGLRVPLVQA